MVENGNDLVTWISENGIPVVNSTFKNSIDYIVDSAYSVTDRVVKQTEVSNKTVRLDIKDLEEITDRSAKKILEVSGIGGREDLNPDSTPSVKPAEFGKDPAEFPYLLPEQNISNVRPFDFSVTNDVFQKLEITQEDLLAPNPDNPKYKYFDAITNPNIPTLDIFSEGVMRWKGKVEKACAKFNSDPRNKGFEVSPNEALLIISIETGNSGSNKKESRMEAVSAFQIVYPQFHRLYIATGAFDGGKGRVLSKEEFKQEMINNEDYAILVFLQYYSDIKRYNQNVYQDLSLNYPFQQFAFNMAEYNGGDFNGRKMFLNQPIPNETWDYVRMALRFGILAEGAQDLRELYPDTYSQLLNSQFANTKLEDAHLEEKKNRSQGRAYSKDAILKSQSDPRLNPGNKTRELFLSEIEPVMSSVSKVEAAESTKRNNNFAIQAINIFEYR
ncbi:MAG: hypothetical protein EBV07_00575 [Proteobacteria bacterium]|nr:hypothetical protein [Pseudomonadota bacterium]